MKKNFSPTSFGLVLLLALSGTAPAQDAVNVESAERGRDAVIDRRVDRGPTQPAPSPTAVAEAWPDQPVLAAMLPEGVTADDLIGRDFQGAEEESLGTVQDVLVDAASGRVLYVLVSSGGMLGIGETLRALPAAAVAGAVPESEVLRPAAPITQDQWEQAPTIDGDPLQGLARAEFREQVDAHFARAVQSGQPAPPNEDGAGEVRLVRASALTGRDLESEERAIGEVDAVLVNLREGGALLRVAPEAGLGMTEPFILRLDDVEVPGGEDPLRTSFTLADFYRAIPDFAEDLRLPDAGPQEPAE